MSLAIIFDMFYLVLAITLFSILYEKSDLLIDMENASFYFADFSLLGGHTTWGLFDVYLIMFDAYILVTFLPTFFVNSVIVAKEIFMK